MSWLKRVSALSLAFLLSLIAYNGSVSEAKTLTDTAARPWIGFDESDNVFCSGNTEEKLIALTFDDGPHPKYTKEILDILNEYGVKATFFVIGENAALYRDEIKRISDEGHELGNHTYTHKNTASLSPAELLSELKRTDSEIFGITGTHPRVFRPPEGKCTKAAVSCAAELGYKIILWTVDPRDWACPTVSEMTDNILSNVRAGSILLCHDYNSAKRSPTPAALRRIIPELIERGYGFVTVSELLGAV